MTHIGKLFPLRFVVMMLVRDRFRDEKKRKREVEEQRREDENERRKKSSTASKKKAKESAAATKSKKKEDASVVAKAEEAVVSANEVPAREVTQYPRSSSSQSVHILLLVVRFLSVVCTNIDQQYRVG